MNRELRKYAIKSQDWELIAYDSIFCVTLEWLKKNDYKYPYLVFDDGQWSGCMYPITYRYIDGLWRQITIEVFLK